MKRVVLLLALASFVFVSCEKDPNNGKLDPNAKVYISPASGVALQTPTKVENPAHLTAKQIVEQAEVIRTAQWRMDIGDWNRDLVKNRFIISPTWAVGSHGELETGFIEARDYVFATLDEENHVKDTLAYIPNKTMQDAEIAIKTAYAAEDYSACYKLMEDAFVFTPITGAEWRALKANDNN